MKNNRVLSLGLWLCAALGGCDGAPRTRLGALPFPGALTLYTLADPNDLGVARYDSWPRLFEADETSRGILYTERGGFLDLAHIRETMDWSWYAAGRVGAALRDRKESLRLAGYDGCPFVLTFEYPVDWDLMSPRQREEVVFELSLRIGELVALDAMTWHEIITWFGYRTTLIVPEKGSAFTYDDTMSHIVAIDAADDAMRHSTGAWDRDATGALDRELRRLQVVPMDEAAIAVELAGGKWWAHGLCIRRNLDLGEASGAIHPWLVRGGPWSDFCTEAFPLPSLSDVQGRDYSGFWRMTIEPSLLVPWRVREVSRLESHAIDPSVHFPVLMEEIRREMREELGPNVDRAYDE